MSLTGSLALLFLDLAEGVGAAGEFVTRVRDAIGCDFSQRECAECLAAMLQMLLSGRGNVCALQEYAVALDESGEG
jgi:hypothetical protein